MEYFAASYLSSICDSPEQLAQTLAPHIARQEWDVVAQLALQIKNRYTQDGAIRFYEAQLGSRRYKAPSSIANLLAFLARCLVFIDMPPRIVRQITDRCLDLTLADPTDRERVSPLGVLMVVESVRHTVTAHLVGRLNAEIYKGEASDGYFPALHLMLALSVPIHTAILNSPQLVNFQYGQYWADVSKDLANAHREQIVIGAKTDMTLALSAYNRCWITLRDVGDGSDTGKAIQFLFMRHIATGVDSSFWTDPASNLIITSIGLGLSRRCLNEQLEEVTEIIADRGSPPWAPGPLNGFVREIRLREVRKDLTPFELSRKGWTGLALLVAIVLEGSAGDASPMVPFEEPYVELLMPLKPYVECRTRGSDVAPSKPLDVEPDFIDLFKAWAARKVDFVSSG